MTVVGPANSRRSTSAVEFASCTFQSSLGRVAMMTKLLFHSLLRERLGGVEICHGDPGRPFDFDLLKMVYCIFHGFAVREEVPAEAQKSLHGHSA